MLVPLIAALGGLSSGVCRVDQIINVGVVPCVGGLLDTPFGWEGVKITIVVGHDMSVGIPGVDCFVLETCFPMTCVGVCCCGFLLGGHVETSLSDRSDCSANVVEALLSS